MNIRLATHDDVSAISTLFSEFIRYNAAQQPEHYVATKENGSYPKGIIDSSSDDIIVAVVDGAIV